MEHAINLFDIFGKHLVCVDGWDGGITHITIKGVSCEGDDNTREYKFTGRGYWGNEQSIWVPAEVVGQLFSEGKARSTQTIDHCTFDVEYRLSDK